MSLFSEAMKIGLSKDERLALLRVRERELRRQIEDTREQIEALEKERQADLIEVGLIALDMQVGLLSMAVMRVYSRFLPWVPQAEVGPGRMAVQDRLASLLDAPVLPTGAGHDAGILAAKLPTAMLFVRNPTGVSHAPEESAEPADIDAGVAALTRVIEELA